MSEQLSSGVTGYGEHAMQQVEVTEAAQLSFARGKVGQRYPLTDDEQRAEFAQNLATHTFELTKANTADCGDERLTVRLADGTDDRETLDARIVPQLFGGIGLATTKALIAADAAVIRDAKNVWDAYLITSKLLASDNIGQEDAGHAGCGASQSVEASVANAIPLHEIVPVAGLLLPESRNNEAFLQQNAATKTRRLEAGFYSNWDPQAHVDYLVQNFPQNFSYLLDDPEDHETHGHNGSGLYVVTQEGVGYQKTGQAFSVTLPKMKELAHKLGGSEEERQRILLGFIGDTADVGAGIVTESFPVFAQAA